MEEGKDPGKDEERGKYIVWGRKVDKGKEEMVCMERFIRVCSLKENLLTIEMPSDHSCCVWRVHILK